MKYDELMPMINAIGETMEKIDEPLSEAQKIVLSGALMIYMEVYEKKIVDACYETFKPK